MNRKDTLQNISDLLESFEVLRAKSPDAGDGEHDVIRATVMRIIDRYVSVCARTSDCGLSPGRSYGYPLLEAATFQE